MDLCMNEIIPLMGYARLHVLFAAFKMQDVHASFVPFLRLGWCWPRRQMLHYDGSASEVDQLFINRILFLAS